MSSAMDEKELDQFNAQVTQLAKGLKSEADLRFLTQFALMSSESSQGPG